jgi:hypothetical protein
MWVTGRTSRRSPGELAIWPITTGPDDEGVIATLPANAPATWTGNWGLTAPGSSATFKFYALTEQGNDRGGNAVTVTRPVG